MRCFQSCFAASKRGRKHFRSANKQTHVAEGALEPAVQLTKQKTDVEEAIDYIAESKIEIEDQSINGLEAEVTSSEEVAKNIEGITKVEHEKASREEKKDSDEGDDEFSKGLVQEESSGSLFSLSFDSRKKASAATKTEIEVDSPMQLPRVTYTTKGAHEAASGSALNPLENVSQGKPSEKEAEEENTLLLEEQTSSIAMRKVSSSTEELINKLEENNEDRGKAKGSNHPASDYRYRDCSNDGYEDVNLDEQVQEESSGSLFSLSTDCLRRFSSTEKVDNEVNSEMPAHFSVHITNEETQARIPDDSSVLNPIENLAQGSVVKATLLQPPTDDKENINSVVQDFTPEPSLKLSNSKARQKKINDKKQEVRVDSSLSSWLVEPETTPISMNSTNSVGKQTPNGGRGSPWSHEDRPILGALTVEEIKKFSVSATSRRTRSPSPDETPIIGTVGSYWSHTRQSKNSKFNNSGEDTKLEWSSPRVKTRLDRAFEACVAEN